MKKIALVLALAATSSALAKNEYSVGLMGGVGQLGVSSISVKNDPWSKGGLSFASSVGITAEDADASRLYNWSTAGSKSGQMGGVGGMQLGYHCTMDQQNMGIGMIAGLSFSGSKVHPEFSTIDTLLVPSGVVGENVVLTPIGKQKIDIKAPMSVEVGPHMFVMAGNFRLGMGVQWRGTQYRMTLVQDKTDTNRNVTGQTKEKRSKFGSAVQLSFTGDVGVNPNMRVGVVAKYVLPHKVKFAYKKDFAAAQMDTATNFKPHVHTKFQNFEALATVTFVMSR